MHESTGNRYSLEEIKSIYESLYCNNYEGGDDDYLEDYERDFSPDRLTSCKTAEEGMDCLRRLICEVIDDTGDLELTREWVTEAGLTDSTILEEIGL